MSSLKDLAVIINIASCTPLILFLPIEGFFIINKSYHIYFKSLCLSLILAVLLNVYANFILDIFYFLDINTIFQSNSRFHGFLLNATKYFAAYGPCICRENLWMICCERIYSTIKRKKYEQMSNKFVAFILFWLPFTYSFNIENICRAWPFFDENYSKICLFSEMLTTTMCIGLYFRCKTLKKMTFDNTLQLCEKYQLSESIRILRFLLPLTAVFIIINVIKHSLYVILDFDNDYLRKLKLFKDSIYFTVYSIFVIKLVYNNFFDYKRKCNKITTTTPHQSIGMTLKNKSNVDSY